jgi:hypothetical protein
VKYPHIGIILLICIQLIIVSQTYTDYGLHWDDYSTRVIGANNALLANQRLDYLLASEEKVKALAADKINVKDESTYLSQDSLENYELSQYGPFFELALIGVEFVLGLESFHDIFYTRHLIVHLFFLISIGFFYALLFQQFQDWKIALLGALILLLSPRIYAHSFFNTKDIPFLAACILVAYSFFRLARNPNYINAGIHALFCAIAIDIRIVGLLFPALTMGLYLNIALREKYWKDYLIQGGFFGLFTFAFVVAFWPYLWKDPLGHLLYSLGSMSKYPWDGFIIFSGHMYQPLDYLPWYYFPKWFLISTPLFYFIGFVAAVISVWQFRLRAITQPGSREQLIIFSIIILVAPWGLAILKDSVLYDGWRHFYFVYPFFVILCIYGFDWFRDRLKLGNTLFYSIMIIPLISTLIVIINMHPYHFLYTNTLVNKPLNSNYDLDYWGLSYKEGLTFLVEYHKEGDINLNVAEGPGEINLLAFPDSVRNRVNLVEIPEADYFMTIYREVIDRKAFLAEKGILEEQKIHEIVISGDVILSVFRLK